MPEITVTLSERHHRFLERQVEQGQYESASAAVAACVESLMEIEAHLTATLSARAEEIRARMATPLEEYVDAEDVFEALLDQLGRNGDG
ncbi:type II toxin-antitoxin system ParD family antitoxin [Salinarimonas sp. NSM]|uniref:type II toxin-antitoxin system ParD family antitoxin n=1 Tax=Salinarimonas sp. NSM TaxID=3458003 RepID=UPI0040374DF2